MCTVDEILDELEFNSDVDIVGLADHDDCRSYAAACDWKNRHPESRIRPIWGSEVTAFGFTHVLAYKMQGPFPTVTPKKFQALRRTVEELNDQGCYVVVPHVDAPMVGVTRSRLNRIASKMPIFGYELRTPYFPPEATLPELQALGDRHDLAALGGSDSHFVEDLYRVILHFPGDSIADFERSWHERTVVPAAGDQGPRKTLRSHLRQQHRSLVGHPSEQVRSWMHQRLDRRDNEPEPVPVR